MTQETNKKSKRKKLILIGLGIGAAGFLGYMGWQQYQKRKSESSEELPDMITPTLPAYNTESSYKPKPANDEFPLKKGSKGQRVKELQQALLAKYGKTILPKYGADGDFGSEMVNALKSKGLPEAIDETAFNVLVKSRSFDAKSLASTLYNAAKNKRINDVVAVLKRMKSTEDYSAVSGNFLLLRFGGVRTTLVNALMNAFSGSQKQQIQMEFVRMGLKYDGNKWALSGIPLRKIITTKQTVVWKDKHTPVNVAANTILGYELAERSGYSLFETLHNQKFIVKTNSIKYV